MHRSGLRGINESINIEWPILPCWEDIERHHGSSHILKVDQLSGPRSTLSQAIALRDSIRSIRASDQLRAWSVAIVELVLKQIHAENGEHEINTHYNDKQVHYSYDWLHEGSDHDLHVLVACDDAQRTQGSQQLNDAKIDSWQHHIEDGHADYEEIQSIPAVLEVRVLAHHKSQGNHLQKALGYEDEVEGEVEHQRNGNDTSRIFIDVGIKCEFGWWAEDDDEHDDFIDSWCGDVNGKSA